MREGKSCKDTVTVFLHKLREENYYVGRFLKKGNFVRHCTINRELQYGRGSGLLVSKLSRGGHDSLSLRWEINFILMQIMRKQNCIVLTINTAAF